MNTCQHMSATKTVEPVPVEHLTVDHIRKNMAAFNYTFERNGGYKGYEVQCIEVLLAEIDRLSASADGVEGK